jgi:hypothetical protein
MDTLFDDMGQRRMVCFLTYTPSAFVSYFETL